MTLRPDEPLAGPWRVESLTWLVELLLRASGATTGRPPVVAVDGQRASGKTTLAERLRLSVPGAQVVHTDDVAWAHSRFGWDDLMIEGVLAPLHRGESVHYQPPAWTRNGREGHVDVSTNAPLVIVEGVGASRREVTHQRHASHRPRPAEWRGCRARHRRQLTPTESRLPGVHAMRASQQRINDRCSPMHPAHQSRRTPRSRAVRSANAPRPTPAATSLGRAVDPRRGWRGAGRCPRRWRCPRRRAGGGSARRWRVRARCTRGQ